MFLFYFHGKFNEVEIGIYYYIAAAIRVQIMEKSFAFIFAKRTLGKKKPVTCSLGYGLNR